MRDKMTALRERTGHGEDAVAEKPTAPRDGSATNLATEGHVLGTGTDVGWNCRTPPWAAVTHQAWLAGSRCGLGPWSEAKAHTAAE